MNLKYNRKNYKSNLIEFSDAPLNGRPHRGLKGRCASGLKDASVRLKGRLKNYFFKYLFSKIFLVFFVIRK